MQLHPRDDGDSGRLTERREVVSEGKTLDEAVQRGIDELGIRKEEADVDVLDVGGGTGLMGRIRGKLARVRVRAKDMREEKLKEVTDEILRLMGIEAEVTVAGEDGTFRIDISSEGADGLLIGRRGETLEALQHIVHRTVAGGDGPLFITVDVSGYRARRRFYLESKARELASVALSDRREVYSEPLTLGERRIFHSVLAEIPYVQARALGEGLHRKIVVAPARDLRDRRGGRREDYEGEPYRPGGSRDRYGAYEEGGREPHEASDAERSSERGRLGGESNRAESLGIPPAPESAVGRQWMRDSGGHPRRTRRTEFLSPSRGFAGSGYGRRSGDQRDVRQQRDTRGFRKPSDRPRPGGESGGRIPIED